VPSGLAEMLKVEARDIVIVSGKRHSR